MEIKNTHAVIYLSAQSIIKVFLGDRALILADKRLYCGDLNMDGKVDFCIHLLSTGCGLAGNCDEVIFLLSDGNNYRKTKMTSMCFQPAKDFLKKPSANYFVHCCLISAYTDKPHNYWVYNLMAFNKNGRIRVKNSILPHFPKWIIYTFKPNSNRAVNISEIIKNKSFRKQYSEYFSFEEHSRSVLFITKIITLVQKNSKKFLQ